MNHQNWPDYFNASVTICNRDGIIVYLNEKSASQFEKYGGKDLIGINLMDCHPEPARSRLRQMLIEPLENTYTTEKDGNRKMIVQKPWMNMDNFMGVIEISIDLPPEIPHYKR